MAAECGFEHRLLRIGPDFLSDYGGYVDRTVYVTDGCAGALWTHEIYLNAQARRLAPVRLTGNFGSEVLRSMSTFKRVGLSRELIAPDFRAQVDAVADDAPRPRATPVTFAAFREIPWNLFGIVASAKSQLTFRTPYLDNDLVALTYRAPSSVRAVVRVCVTPGGDANPRLGTIPTDRGVVADGSGLGLHAEASVRRTHIQARLHAQGGAAARADARFLAGALDKVGLLGLTSGCRIRLWFQNELAKHVVEALTDPATLRLPFWNQRVLTRWRTTMSTGRRNHVREINAVLTLAAVDRLLIAGGAMTSGESATSAFSLGPFSCCCSCAAAGRMKRYLFLHTASAPHAPGECTER